MVPPYCMARRVTQEQQLFLSLPAICADDLDDGAWRGRLVAARLARGYELTNVFGAIHKWHTAPSLTCAVRITAEFGTSRAQQKGDCLWAQSSRHHSPSWQ